MPFYRIRQLKLPLDHAQSDIERKALQLLGVRAADLAGFSIERKSVDARDRRDIRFVYSVIVELKREPSAAPTGNGIQSVAVNGTYEFPPPRRTLDGRPVIVGAGPAGLFCALLLAEHGYRPLLLERGDDVDARHRAVNAFFETGILDPESNIQFGEGGAGTYSDGKLATSIADEGFRSGRILGELVEAGAPPEIRWEAKPHVGTDYLRGVVRRLREKIVSLGGEVRFRSRVTGILLSGDRASGVVVGGSERIDAAAVVLAIGHSARDSFRFLHDQGLPLERKPFAIGLRVEHPQEMISRGQYGDAWKHPALPVADYRLTHRAADGRGVYTFCMCPGGYVVNSSSEPGMIACNGMSDFRRDSPNANSAVVVTVGPDDFGGEGALAGMEFQRKWERLAFEAGGGAFALPVQTFVDFSEGRPSASLGAVTPSVTGRFALADLNGCLPDYVACAIREGMRAFDAKIPGFARPDALLTGVETRTSSPVRILRDERLESAVRCLYPCGEGAGYAGGIMSAAIDGMRVAETIATR
ncbi:MAG: NAD(P)-binding protein [Spirochaetes bacterium]|nr:NAD(P)-binding protein [Spirochaetota bacterium]